MANVSFPTPSVASSASRRDCASCAAWGLPGSDSAPRPLMRSWLSSSRWNSVSGGGQITSSSSSSSSSSSL
eukprot:1786942-Pyramimonas_sp.AAC.1